MKQSEQSVHDQAMDRVSAMTEAGQQQPQYKDSEHELFAINSRVAAVEGGYRGTIVAE